MDFLDAVFISFWHQSEVFIEKFSLYSNLSPDDKKCNFRFWVLVCTIGIVYYDFTNAKQILSWLCRYFSGLVQNSSSTYLIEQIGKYVTVS